MQEKHLKLVGVGWVHSQITLVAVKDDGGELKEEYSAFSENLKKNWTNLSVILNIQVLESLMSKLCKLNLLRFSELIFLWVYSDHCESTQLVNQLNLLWANSQLVESA